MPLVQGDARSEWDPELLSDRRVSYFWDEERISGFWFSEHVSGQKPLAWDAYFLYDAGGTWDDVPGPLISEGYTIIDMAERLKSDLLALDTE